MAPIHVSPWTIYWIMQMDSICITFEFFALLLGILTLGMGINWFLHADEEDYNKARKNFLCIFPIFTFFILTVAFVPDTKTLATIYLAPAIINNENIQKEAAGLYEVAKQALIDSLTPNKNERNSNAR